MKYLTPLIVLLVLLPIFPHATDLPMAFAAGLDTTNASEGYKPPLVSVGRTVKPPSVDGTVSVGEWENSASVTGFLSIETLALSDRQTTVRITYDAESIYFLYRSSVEGGRSLTTDVRDRDGRVWNDDAIELFLNVPGNGVVPDVLYQFAGNSADAVFDRRNTGAEGFDSKWDGNWTYASRLDSGVWTSEISIRFADMGTVAPPDGSVWRANFARDWQKPTDLTAWTMSSEFADVSKMGYLRFAGNGPIFGVESFGNLVDKIEFPGFLRLPEGYRRSDVAMILSAENKGTVLARQTPGVPTAEGSTALVPFRLDLAKEGADTFRLRVDSGETESYRAVIPFRTRSVLDLELLPIPSRGICTVTARVLDADLAARSSGIAVRVVSEADAGKVNDYRIERLDGRSGRCEIDIASLRPGDYRVEADLLTEGRIGGSGSAKLTKPDEAWRDVHVGADDRVLPPWKPVRVASKGGSIDVSVWGRVYTFDSGGLPSRILTRGRQILASPMTWSAAVDGKPLAWTRSSVRAQSKSPTRASFTVNQDSDRLITSSVIRVEYDGMIWGEYSFIPRGQTTLDSLELQMPIKAEHFKYRNIPYTFTSTGTNDVIDGGEYIHELPSCCYLWVGDEERGLTWFFNRPGQFATADKSKAVRITRKGDVITLHVRFVDRPIKIDGPLKFAFGFQATPTRPLPDGWRMRGGERWLGESWDVPWTYEAYTKYGGGYPESSNPDHFRGMIDGLHKKSIRAVPYVCLRWRDRNSPDWQYNRIDWELPGGISNYSEARQFWHGHEVCAESASYRDWMTYKVKRLVDDYRLDGLYHDLQWPYVCSNANHGCKDGRSSLLGARELNRRVYAILRATGRPTMKIDHYSSDLCDPIGSFCDAVVSGEEMASGGSDPATIEPWRVINDYFRIADIRGHLIASGMAAGQRGPIPWFLPELRGDGLLEGTRGMMALLLPIDAGWTVWNGSNDFTVMHRLWRAAKDFGLGDPSVQFTGFWSKDLPVKPAPAAGQSQVAEAPLVSIWSRGKIGALAVVANHSTDADMVADIAFDLKRLRMSGPVEVADAECRLKWYRCGGTVRLPVRKKDYRLVWLRPAKIAAGTTPMVPQSEAVLIGGCISKDTPQAQTDLAVGRIVGADTTKFAQTLVIDHPVLIDHVRAFLSDGGKMRNWNSTEIRTDESDPYTLNRPEIAIVKLDEHGLPSETTAAPDSRITFSEARPGESTYRRYFYDRLTPLQPGAYAVVFSRVLENGDSSYTFSLGLCSGGSRPGNYACYFDGRSWSKLDKSAAVEVYGYVKEGDKQ